ncbi:NAD(P)-binding protein [Mycena filopes]|nr:NAD(P)-binding protein [Mycena filopes]
MTIIQLLDSPLIVVVGATGAQGGSVITALADSTHPYRIRGFTRDVAKPASVALAERGVEMVALDLVVENREAVYEAFTGADFAFLVTNFWEHMNAEKEISEGKLLVDAAKNAGVMRLIWSGLSSITQNSSGKYTHAVHFDNKAAVTAYARASGVPFVDVQAGVYTTNFLGPLSGLRKQADGSYALEWAVKPETVVPVLDIARDYGRFVRRALEAPVFPAGSEVLTSSEDITAGELIRQLAEITGKKVVFKQISVEEGEKQFVAVGLPPTMATAIIECFSYFNEFGWLGGKSSATHEGLGGPTGTWAAFVKAADWTRVLA